MPPKAAPKTTTPIAPPPAGHASPAASDAIVNLYLILSDRYDKARKAYIAGWDDARVAVETGLALPVVQERRERDFGPLVVDTAREDLLRGLDEMDRLMLSATAKSFEASKAAAEAAQILVASEKLRDEVRALAQRLAAAPIEKAA